MACTVLSCNVRLPLRLSECHRFRGLLIGLGLVLEQRVGPVFKYQEPDTLPLKAGTRTIKQRRRVHSRRSTIKISTIFNSDALTS